MHFRLRSAATVFAISLLSVLSCFAADNKRALVEHCQPSYPEIARQMHVSGSIFLQISILPNGRVGEIRLESGHPLLAGSAEDAVRRWRYKPAAETTLAVVQVDFNL